MSQVTFYTLADSRYFIGVVALFNSLRLTGNHGELVVLDCGFTEDQRRRLATRMTVETLPPEVAKRKVLAKPFVHRLAPSGVVVWVDSDILVTRSFEPLARLADEGKVCLYPGDWLEERQRWVQEWQSTLGLLAPLRRQRYLNAGLIVFSTTRWPDLLRRWWEVCQQIPAETLFTGDPESNPFWAHDQDALNALLMSELPAEAVMELPEEEAVFPSQMHGVRIRDARTLTCVHRGRLTTVLHYSWTPKPWQSDALRRVRRDAYTRLMPRVLFGEDVPMRLERDEVVPWLRGGLGWALRLQGIAAGRGLWEAARRIVWQMPPPVRERLYELRRHWGSPP